MRPFLKCLTLPIAVTGHYFKAWILCLFYTQKLSVKKVSQKNIFVKLVTKYAF